MSTVRMSDQLQNDIASKAENIYVRANPDREFSLNIGNKLYDKYLKTKLESMQTFLLAKENASVLEPAFLKSKGIYEIDTTLEYTVAEERTDYDGNDVPELVHKKIHYRLPTSNLSMIALLTSDPDSYRDDVRVNFKLDISGSDSNGILTIEDVVLDCPLIKEVFNTHHYNDKLYDGKRAYKQTVRETIANFSTLNQALKAWPALKDLVPQDKIDKVYEKVERNVKVRLQREAIEVQEQALNSVILTASLLD